MERLHGYNLATWICEWVENEVYVNLKVIMNLKMNMLFTTVSLLWLLDHSIAKADFVYKNECSSSDCDTEVHVSDGMEVTAKVKIEDGNSTIVIVAGDGAKSPKIAAAFSQEEVIPRENLLNLNQIPIKFLEGPKSEIYAGLTELQPKSEIYVGALHVFKRNSTELISSETSAILSKLRPILVKNILNQKYQDLIFFVPRDMEEGQFKTIISKLVTKHIQSKVNQKWKSLQIGTTAQGAVRQFSEGLINMVTIDQSSGVHYFYLDDSIKNFSSTRSSGSLIFDEHNLPLGVLQCKEMEAEASLRGDGRTDLFRAISLDLDFDEFHLEAARSIADLLTKAQNLEIEQGCIPVDKNGAGDL